jgi:hypothetical protein
VADGVLAPAKVRLISWRAVCGRESHSWASTMSAPRWLIADQL